MKEGGLSTLEEDPSGGGPEGQSGPYTAKFLIQGRSTS
jgi:hypothetical protein